MGLLILPLVALTCGLLSKAAIGRSHSFRWTVALGLPLLFLVGLGYLAFDLTARFATCEEGDGDCGPSTFLAAALVAFSVSVSGFIGSGIGVWLGFPRSPNRLPPVEAADR
jgi:hypothetical protein